MDGRYGPPQATALHSSPSSLLAPHATLVCAGTKCRAAMLHFAKRALGMRAANGFASRSGSDRPLGKAKELKHLDEARRGEEEGRKRKGG
jgi:hypothetical protein